MTLGKVLTTMALMGVALTGIEAAAQVPTVWVIGDSTASNVDRRGSVAWPRATEPNDTYLRRAGGRALMTGTRLLPGSAAGGGGRVGARGPLTLAFRLLRCCYLFQNARGGPAGGGGGRGGGGGEKGPPK